MQSIVMTRGVPLPIVYFAPHFSCLTGSRIFATSETNQGQKQEGQGMLSSSRLFYLLVLLQSAHTAAQL